MKGFFRIVFPHFENEIGSFLHFPHPLRIFCCCYFCIDKESEIRELICKISSFIKINLNKAPVKVQLSRVIHDTSKTYLHFRRNHVIQDSRLFVCKNRKIKLKVQINLLLQFSLVFQFSMCSISLVIQFSSFLVIQFSSSLVL